MSTRSVSFELLVDADAGSLPRLLAPFARRDLVPDQLRARRVGDCLQASIGHDAMPLETIPLVEGNLRQVIGVRRLEVVVRANVRAVA